MPIVKQLLQLSLSLILFSPLAHAWEGHSLMTFLALQKMPELLAQPAATAETVESFLEKEKTGLIQLLNENEKWSIQHITAYPPLPPSLSFQSLVQQKKPLTLAWMESIRINPQLSFPLYVQHFPGIPYHSNQALPASQAMLSWLATEPSIHIYDPPLESIKAGTKLSPLQIIATAADEPDYGLDIELWKENHSWFSDLYQWGPQPFGNAKVRLSSQGPFHMGFYYEPSIFYAADNGLKRCFPEYRIHLYLSLAKYAFKTNHPYWGYRFLGWAIHYIQDLAQPYHSTALPNVNLFKIFSAQILDIIHLPSAKINLIQLVTNKHYGLENYEFYQLLNAAQKNNVKDPIIYALINQQNDQRYPAYSDSYPRHIVAKESHEKANLIDATILRAFPKRYVSDPNYVFYITEPDINLVKITENNHRPDIQKLDVELRNLLNSIGSHTRSIVRYALKSNNPIK